MAYLHDLLTSFGSYALPSNFMLQDTPGNAPAAATSRSWRPRPRQLPDGSWINDMEELPQDGPHVTAGQPRAAEQLQLGDPQAPYRGGRQIAALLGQTGNAAGKSDDLVELLAAGPQAPQPTIRGGQANRDILSPWHGSMPSFRDFQMSVNPLFSNTPPLVGMDLVAAPGGRGPATYAPNLGGLQRQQGHGEILRALLGGYGQTQQAALGQQQADTQRSGTVGDLALRARELFGDPGMGVPGRLQTAADAARLQYAGQMGAAEMQAGSRTRADHAWTQGFAALTGRGMTPRQAAAELQRMGLRPPGQTAGPLDQQLQSGPNNRPASTLTPTPTPTGPETPGDTINDIRYQILQQHGIRDQPGADPHLPGAAPADDVRAFPAINAFVTRSLDRSVPFGELRSALLSNFDEGQLNRWMSQDLSQGQPSRGAILAFLRAHNAAGGNAGVAGSDFLGQRGYSGGLLGALGITLPDRWYLGMQNRPGRPLPR